MNHVNLNTATDAVREVILSFKANGTVFELDGRPIACLIPPPTQPDDAPEWTVAKNARRFYLIDKEIDGTIALEEELELQILEVQYDQFMDRVAPLPLEHARRLPQELVEKSRSAGTERAAPSGTIPSASQPRAL